MGLVSQEPLLFETSLFENICHRYSFTLVQADLRMIGTTLEVADDKTKWEAVEKACTMANTHSFITELPEKYNTRVGEGGFFLSSGQK